MAFFDKYIKDSDRFEFIHMSGDRNEQGAVLWAKKHKLPWPHVMFEDFKKSGLGELMGRGWPTYALIDGDGKVVMKGSSAMKKVAEMMAVEENEEAEKREEKKEIGNKP